MMCVGECAMNPLIYEDFYSGKHIYIYIYISTKGRLENGLMYL